MALVASKPRDRARVNEGAVSEAVADFTAMAEAGDFSQGSQVTLVIPPRKDGKGKRAVGSVSYLVKGQIVAELNKVGGVFAGLDISDVANETISSTVPTGDADGTAVVVYGITLGAADDTDGSDDETA